MNPFILPPNSTVLILTFVIGISLLAISILCTRVSTKSVVLHIASSIVFSFIMFLTLAFNTKDIMRQAYNVVKTQCPHAETITHSVSSDVNIVNITCPHPSRNVNLVKLLDPAPGGKNSYSLIIDGKPLLKIGEKDESGNFLSEEVNRLKAAMMNSFNDVKKKKS